MDVLVAGSASTTGASHLILRLSELGPIEGVSSEQARREVERNLRKKLPHGVPLFEALADATCRWVKDPTRKQVAAVEGQAHPKDLPILAAALSSGCEWLVTFNTKDFRPAKGTLTVAEPGLFVDALRKLLQDLVEP